MIELTSENVSIESDIKDDARMIFKDNWESAKASLEQLANIVRNPALKALILTIIALGSAVRKRI